VTLSDDAVSKLLTKNFVCGWRSIKGATSYAGTSNTHKPNYDAITVSNCAGHHNVQLFFMTADGKILHCLPGFWAPKYFLHEAQFALDLAKVYYQKSLTPVKRNQLYLNLHLEHALGHDKALRDASHHQGFDKQNLEKREKTDFKREDGFVAGELKTPDQVLHERMAEHPFVDFEKFDVAKFIDMGLKQYKYDVGVPGKDGSAKPTGAGGAGDGDKADPAARKK
jgi:hypothetical protein